MGDENPIRTLEDYSKPSNEGYRNTIELPKWNNVDPNQHLKDFLKLVDSLDLDIANRERTRESLSEAWTRFKDLLQKVPHRGSTFGFKSKSFTTMSMPPQDEPLTNRPVICSGPHNTQYCMENPEQAFVDYVSSHIDEAGGWNDSKDSIKPVKVISVSLNASKTPDRRLLELEEQINFLLKGPKPVPRASSTNISQAYAEAISSNPHLQNLNEPPRQNSFTFYERVRPNPQPEALGTNFEARVRDYMALHTERMERFENAIFKQREKINDKMAEMFRLLKELTASRTLDKVLIREETRHPTTKNVNSISLIQMEEEKNVENNRATNKSVAEPSKSDEQEPPKEVDKTNKGGRRANDEPAKSARENITKNEEEETAGISSSHTVGYYLKHRINEILIEGLVENQRFNDSLSATQVIFDEKKLGSSEEVSR
ncbi:hypothetical protein Tco_0822649 [Tanacetum coccineum]|uniref:MAK10-like protein n=1 Tax=Tanacetum coccineum TaxID=301880 RepID=A0ABQ5AFN7_9ASTR